MNACTHEWEATGEEILTFPGQPVYRCNRCQLVTHDPKTGEICRICSPERTVTGSHNADPA